MSARKKTARRTGTRQRPPAKVTASNDHAMTVPAGAGLLDDLRGLILSAREGVARAVDAALTLLYWEVGHRIHREVLQEKRADYGARIVVTLARQLEAEFGRAFEEKNLRRMVQFAEVFPDRKIVATLSRQLSWSHFLTVIPLKDGLKRDFYAELCRIEKWTLRTLRDKIDSMLYERTALSKKPEALIRQEIDTLRTEDRMTPDLVFRDPYILDFLGLKDTYAEKDLEAAILREMEGFILEVGTGFAFVARQKRMIVGGEDHHLDLLFYHRGLRRLVAIELKLSDFKPADKGQMELYLAWLDRHERAEGEEKPIGLILCAGKNDETIELLDLGRSGIRVAAYWTELLPKEQLRRKLHEVVIRARAGLATRGAEGGERAAAPVLKPAPSPDAPTRQQGQFLAFIQEHMLHSYAGVAPTHAAFQKFFNLTPPSVNSMLQRLEARGFIRRVPGKARGIELSIDPALIPPLERPFKF